MSGILPDGVGAETAGMADSAVPEKPAALPRISTQAEVDALAPGAEFLDPSGTKRIKPWAVRDADTYRRVPDGAVFVDPTGTRRVKPTYEGLDLATQTLVDMAHGNPRQIAAILAGEYPGGAVKTEPLTGEVYVEREGRRYKPDRGSWFSRSIARSGALAAPVTASTAGAILGAASGIPALGVGAVPGGVIGAAVGGAGGEAFNQMMLALAGYGSSFEDYVGAVGREAAWSGGGQAAGSLLVHGVGKAIEGSRSLKDAARMGPFFAKLLGAQPEETAQALRLTEKGALVRPSAWLKEAPYLRKVVEEFDPTFRQQDVLARSAEAFYDKEGRELMKRLGVEPPARALTDPAAPPPSEEFGQLMLATARSRLAAADRRLTEAVAAARSTVLARHGVPDPAAHEAALTVLRQAEQQARQAAQDVIDVGFRNIEADVRAAFRATEADANPGALNRLAVGKIRALRQAIGARARVLYQNADQAAGDARPDIGPLVDFAHEFLAQAPKEFVDRYPAIVRAISRLEAPAGLSAAEREAAADLERRLADPALSARERAVLQAERELLGEAPPPAAPDGEVPEPPTFGQLHWLRTALRQDVDPYDLTPGVREGAFKAFIGKINDVLFSEAATPELKEAAQLLARADDFYGRNIAKFKAHSLKWAVGEMEAGVPPDPAMVAREFLRPGHSEEIAMARKVLGKPLWHAVQAADTRAMLDASRTLVPGEYDGGAFAREVLDRMRSGVLDAAYDRSTAQRLVTQAQAILRKEGKLPLAAEEGDTISTLMRRAESLAAEIDERAKADPVRLLADELRQLERGARQIRGEQARARRANPLHFLEQPSMGALEAADRILAKPDLILSVARQYGETGPEFTMLRQVWTSRLFQREYEGLARLQSEFAEKIRPEIQQLMFPGVELDNARQLARDMDFLLPRGGQDFGGNLAAATRVLNPGGQVAVRPTPFWEKVPGVNTALRTVLSKYYEVMSWAVTHPAFVRYIAAGLGSGDPAMRDLAAREFRASFLKWRQGAGALGAGAGAAIGGTTE